MKKAMASLCCILFFSFVPVYAEALISAQAAILMEASTGYVLFEKNADQLLPMASTTKILTALAVCELCLPDEQVTVSSKAAATEGSRAYLQAGERLSVEQLLYALLLSSGNDAAEALAEYAGKGSRAEFLRILNEKAVAWGLESTKLLNPSGLPEDGHESTARDMAQAARLVLRQPLLRKIVGTKSFSFSSQSGQKHTLSNHNLLLRTYPYATGMKTGYTRAAGRCLVSSAMRDGIELICVTLRDPDDWRDHAALLDLGFSRLSWVEVEKAGELMVSLPIAGGDGLSAVGENRAAVRIPMPQEGLPLTSVLEVEPLLSPPIQRGQKIGSMLYLYNGTPIARCDLCAAAEVTVSYSAAARFRLDFERLLIFLLL